MTPRKKTHAQRFAVLIDADNASVDSLTALLEEVATYGVASVRRAYGDWTTPNLASWKECLNQHAIHPIQQFRYTTGKNATDSALIIDAMDLLYRDHLDGFCLVSSDSDFTRLATRLRESRMLVIGFGRKSTPRPFVAACDRFVYTENLHIAENRTPAISPAARKATPAVSPVAKEKTPVVSPPAVRKSTNDLRADTKLISLLRKAVESAATDDGWAHLGPIGQNISKQSSGFRPRNYGYASLSTLIAATGLFDVQDRKSPAGNAQKCIRDKRLAKTATK